MLSCRHSGPESAQYERRLKSADSILSTVSHGKHEILPPLPLVPYAVAMATTVVYRALRDKRRDVESASRDLLLFCDSLDGLSDRWTSAKGVARLASRLLGFRTISNSMRQLHTTNEPVGSDPTSDSRSITDDRTQSQARYRANESVQSETAIHTPITFQASMHLREDQVTHHHDTQEYTDEQYPEDNISYLDLNNAFDDLFHHGISDVFRDPATWEFLHIGSKSEEPLY